jgi:hypothetical protein
MPKTKVGLGELDLQRSGSEYPGTGGVNERFES